MYTHGYIMLASREEADKMAVEKIQFRPGNLMAELQKRTGELDSPDLIARRDLGRYYSLISRSVPKFTYDEAEILTMACELWRVSDPDEARYIWAEVELWLEESAPQSGYSDEWIGDHLDLVNRLKDMEPIESMAVTDAIERARIYWLEGGTDDAEHVYRKVGLVPQAGEVSR